MLRLRPPPYQSVSIAIAPNLLPLSRSIFPVVIYQKIMLLLSTIPLFVWKARAQQNDFRSRSLEDSWGHQAMRINRWSVMHRVWDGLYDLKDVKAENEWSTIDNAGNERTSDSPLSKQLDSQYKDLIDAENLRLSELKRLLEEQKSFNQSINSALSEIGDITETDRNIYMTLIESLTKDQQLLSESLGNSILKNYSEINSLKLVDEEFNRDLEMTRFERSKGDLDVLTKCSKVEKDYLDSRSNEAERLLELYTTFLGRDTERRQAIDKLRAQLQDDADKRKVARNSTWKKYLDMREALPGELDAMRKHSLQNEVILESELKQAEAQQMMKLQADFLEKMNEIQRSYDKDRMKYLVDIQRSMVDVKLNVAETKKRKLMLLQEDKRQILENIEVSERLETAGYRRNATTGTWSSAQSRYSMTFSLVLHTLITFPIVFMLLI